MRMLGWGWAIDRGERVLSRGPEESFPTPFRRPPSSQAMHMSDTTAKFTPLRAGGGGGDAGGGRDAPDPADEDDAAGAETARAGVAVADEEGGATAAEVVNVADAITAADVCVVNFGAHYHDDASFERELDALFVRLRQSAARAASAAPAIAAGGNLGGGALRSDEQKLLFLRATTAAHPRCADANVSGSAAALAHWRAAPAATAAAHNAEASAAGRQEVRCATASSCRSLFHLPAHLKGGRSAKASPSWSSHAVGSSLHRCFAVALSKDRCAPRLLCACDGERCLTPRSALSNATGGESARARSLRFGVSVDRAG